MGEKLPWPSNEAIYVVLAKRTGLTVEQVRKVIDLLDVYEPGAEVLEEANTVPGMR